MDEIVYYDRYREALCTELVYGDEALLWTYGTTAGRIALHVLVKRVLFSRWYGWWMDRAATRQKIEPFIEDYQLDASEFVLRPEEFRSFNEFFFRKLKPEARPIDPRASSVVFPADGRHLCVPDLSQCDGLFVKGEMFDLETLVGDRELARRYERGSLLLSRLCPTDYHRFHFPVSGTPGEARLLNGPLFSVNPIALCQNIQILATNKRVLTKLTTELCGTVLVMEIGATCVGGICQTYQPGAAVSKGDEKGYFRFGGSSTIMIFEPGRIAFDADLIEQSRQHRELYAHMGDAMG
ncbi:MAG: phosphatidylserine decarboxylase, partial [Planctomycetaceae bacterium]|nr:phosphatidylserine decarboxylase [Planctomycetaceae bacterium]